MSLVFTTCGGRSSMYIPHTNSGPLFAGQEDTIGISGLSPGVAAIILVVSLCAYSFINAVEIAMVSISRLRVRHLSEQGNRAAKAIERLQEHQERFFSFV